LETAARYPGRIAAIYIRDLGGKNRKDEAGGRARTLCERARSYGTEMLWIEHASQALSHAREHGLAAAGRH
jgi:phosphatidate phosphatase APP1